MTTDDLKKLPVTMFEDCECIDYVRLAISSKVGADVEVSMVEEEEEIVVDQIDFSSSSGSSQDAQNRVRQYQFTIDNSEVDDPLW